MSKMIKIALVDDESLLIEGFKLLFSNVKNIQVVKTASDGSEFLNILEESSDSEKPDIALVDIQMKPMDGFELVEILKDKHPDIKIIILSSHYKANVVGTMIKLGVSAFIPKNSSKENLVTAIESVCRSSVYFTPSDKEMLVKYAKNKPKKFSVNNLDNLSEREVDVLKLICLEFTNQEIGDKLFISKRTVDGHRLRLLEKIGAKNTVGLVVYAIANNIHATI